MGGYIHMIETDKPVKIEVESFITWFKENDCDIDKDDMPSEDSMRESISQFNETQSVDNDNSAGPIPIQMAIEGYIENVLGLKISLLEVYSDTIITLPSPAKGYE